MKAKARLVPDATWHANDDKSAARLVKNRKVIVLVHTTQYGWGWVILHKSQWYYQDTLEEAMTVSEAAYMMGGI